MRKFISMFIMVTLLVTSFAFMQIDTYAMNGTCGDSLTWSFNSETGVLTISGTGDMYDYDYYQYNRPWESIQDDVKEIIFSEEITKIGTNAFRDFESITSVEIPASVISLGNSSFMFCDLLESINVDENNPYYVSIDGVVYTKEKDIIFTYPSGKKDTIYTILDGVKIIGKYAFVAATNLEHVIIPETTTTVHDYGFYCCEFESFAFPESITYIGHTVFAKCYSLTSIYIPDGVTFIGIGAFKYCEALKDVYFGGNEETWSKITMCKDNQYLIDATLHYSHIHLYKETVVSANNCTENGKSTFACECGGYYEKVVPATGHSFGEWEIIKEATDNELGEKKHTCSKCDYSETVTFKKAYELGDVNGDGKVTAIDARWALQAASGKKQLTSQQFKCADINSDGNISTIDARKILKLASSF